MNALEKFVEEQIRTNLDIEDRMYTQKWEGFFKPHIVHYFRIRLTNGHVICGKGDTKEKAMEDCLTQTYAYMKSLGTFRNKRNVAIYG